jgi:hypothetical protein
MRDSIAGAWLYSLVLIFMVILVAFISISINYNKAYKLKTSVVNVIEQNQGVNPKAVETIGKYLNNNGYLNGKVCRRLFKNGQKYLEIDNGVSSGVKTKGSGDEDSKPAQVCITRTKYNMTNDAEYVARGVKGTSQIDYYYDVYMFFSFSLPVFGEVFKFNVVGTTNAIHYPNDVNSW